MFITGQYNSSPSSKFPKDPKKCTDKKKMLSNLKRQHPALNRPTAIPFNNYLKFNHNGYNLNKRSFRFNS